MTDRSGGPGLRLRVDLDRLERNLTRFHGHAAARGVAVRAHVKGHRTVEIAVRQQRAGARGIAVTQIAQARHYAAAGIADMVVAVPWTQEWRWRLAAGFARECRLSVHVDSVAAVRGYARAAESAGSVLGIRVQLGTADDMTTTPDAVLLGLARAAAAEPALRLDGVTGYRAVNTVGEAPHADRIGRDAARYAVRIARMVRDDGLPCPQVAVGGTPTAFGAMAVPGVTEVCAGAYALADAGMAAMGFCTPDDVAVSAVVDDPLLADPVLAAYPYPWQTPADYEGLGGSVPPGTPLTPPHICATLLRTGTVAAYENGRLDGTWRVLNDPDEPAPRTTPPAR